MRKMQDIRCSQCGEIERDRYVDTAALPPHTCGGRWESVYLPGHANAVIGDDIPGGLEIKNLLVNEDGSPRTFYTKSAIRREAEARGYTWGAVDHVPQRGSDKSPHTSKWV